MLPARRRSKTVTLSNRLSFFFLGALAVVLVGFSTALYVLAREHLFKQADERADHTVQMLVAAVEVNPDGLEWEPSERGPQFPSPMLADPLVWSITDERGQIVERGGAGYDEEIVPSALQRLGSDPPAAVRLEWRGQDWQFRHKRIESDDPCATGVGKYSAMNIMAGVSLAAAEATLLRLAMVLGGLSLSVWLAALVFGRLLCRRALAPLRKMADSTGAINAVDLDRRIPVDPSGDELEELGHAFNALLARLQESFERQRRFTGDASHQLRTPLTAMLGQVEVALRRERPAEEYRRVLSCVQEQSERLRQIVAALLFLARADAEATAPERTRICLNDFLEQHLRGWMDHPRRGDIHMSSVSTEPIQVEVPPVLLGELINALVDNACKYSPANTPIVIELDSTDARATLAVRDHGQGIAEIDTADLFKPFFRADEVRRQGIEGVCLGLSVAKRLAEALGGTLSVASTLGKGSCFMLSLPRLSF
jgi:signal transduction histidine kinase